MNNLNELFSNQLNEIEEEQDLISNQNIIEDKIRRIIIFKENKQKLIG